MFFVLNEGKPAERERRSSGNSSRSSSISPGLTVFLQVPPLITLGQNEGRSQYSSRWKMRKQQNLNKWAPVLEAKLRTIAAN